MSWVVVLKSNGALLGAMILFVAFSLGVLGAEPLVGTTGVAAPAFSGGHSPAKQMMELLSGYLGKRGACAGSPSAEFLLPILTQALSLPSPPPKDVALRITSCRWDPVRKELQFYLRCSDPDTCRPFLATLRADDYPVPSPHAANELRFARRAIGGNSTSYSAKEAPLVRVGETARLDLTGPGIHIRLAVTCLELGVLGQQVRARVVGESKVLLAKVTGPQILTAELP